MTYDVQWRHYYKQWENSDLREIIQILHHSKGNDESFPKCSYWKLSDWIKNYCYLSTILADLVNFYLTSH